MMRRIWFFLGTACGFVAAAAIASSAATGCVFQGEAEQVELEPGTFSAVILPESVGKLGFTSVRMTWSDPDMPVILEYVSADDARSYRVEYTIVGEEKEGHAGSD